MNHLNLLASVNPVEHVVPRNIIIGSYELSFSNHMLMIMLAAAVLLIVLPLAVRQRTMVPSGLRNLVEMICGFIREEVARPVLGENTDKFIKFLWTTFFFILVSNLLGLIPIAGIVYLVSGGRLRNAGGVATGNIWVTGALAIVAFLTVHVSGIRRQVLGGYLKNFIPPVPWPLRPLMYPLELISASIKPFALAVRLFANMLAGHTVLAAFLGLAFMSRSYTIGAVTVLACAAMSLLELFVACLQAYIFAFLTEMFIAGAVQPEH